MRAPIGRLRLMDFEPTDDLVKVGYEYAQAEVAAWVASGALDGLRE